MKRRVASDSFSPRFSSLALAVCCVVPSVEAEDAAAAEGGTTLLEEVVVTARYREESLQEVPASIRAFRGEDLDRLGINSLGDLTRLTPSLNVQERGPNRNELNIRGVTNFLTTQDMAPSARPVGLYIDEVPFGQLGGSQIDIRNFDLARVEILRGPQGTLYGEGSSAGALRYFSRDPDFEGIGGRIEAEGIYMPDGGEDWGLRGALNLPLGDAIGLRVSGGRYATPGYLDVIGGDDDVNDFEAHHLRAVLLAQPSDRFSARLMVNYDDSTVGSLGLATGDPEDLESSLPQGNDRIDDESLIASLKLSWSFDSLTISSITGYLDRDRSRRTVDQIFSLSNSLASLPLFGVRDFTFLSDEMSYEQWSQEFRLVSNLPGPFRYTAGVFYKDLSYENGLSSTTSDTYLLVGQPSAYDQEIFAARGLSVTTPTLVNDGEQLSAFAEVEYAITDRWNLIAGVRYHKEDLEAFSPANPIILGLAPFPLPAVSADISIDTVLPKVAVEFQWSDDTLLYGQYATGARNGNINSAATLALLETFVPGSSAGLEGFDEDATASVEFGFKTRLLGGRATFNAAVFYTEYDDLQVLVNTPPLGFAVILNAGEASSQGFEAEFLASVTDRLSVFAGVGYTDSQLEEELVTNQLTSASLDSGTTLPNAPDWNINAGFEFEAPAFAGANWYFTGNASYTGDYTTGLNARAVTLGGFAVANAGFGLRGSNWSADLLVTNLFDAAEIVAQNPFNGVVTDQGIPLPPGVDFNETFLLQPRTLRLALRYEF